MSRTRCSPTPNGGPTCSRRWLRYERERPGDGSSRGIGRAIALRAAADGLDVVVHCRSKRAEADAVAGEIRALGRASRVLQFDVADRAACAEAITQDIAA